MTIIAIVSTSMLFFAIPLFCYLYAKAAASFIIRSEQLENTVTQEIAKKLLDVKTDGPKELPFFSAGDKAKIFQQWMKRGLIR